MMENLKELVHQPENNIFPFHLSISNGDPLSDPILFLSLATNKLGLKSNLVSSTVHNTSNITEYYPNPNLTKSDYMFRSIFLLINIFLITDATNLISLEECNCNIIYIIS